jgi:RNA polymerase sigma-70 factor (ECF subfamily)
MMTAVKGGDFGAFDQLERKVRGRAYAIARSLVGSRDDAMELCQEAFLKVFRARETYDPTQPFLPWFHRILRNTCFSYLRKSRRLRMQSTAVRNAEGEEGELALEDIKGRAPGADLDEKERAGLFWDAYESLSERDREIISLRHFEEMAYKDIAEMLDIPEGTVMSRLYHARRRLREGIGPLIGENADVTMVAPRKKRAKAD